MIANPFQCKIVGRITNRIVFGRYLISFKDRLKKSLAVAQLIFQGCFFFVIEVLYSLIIESAIFFVLMIVPANSNYNCCMAIRYETISEILNIVCSGRSTRESAHPEEKKLAIYTIHQFKLSYRALLFSPLRHPSHISLI